MSIFNPTGPNEHAKDDKAPGRRLDNPLLAFGSETGDPPAAEWAPAGAKSGQQRLAEVSWGADAKEATPSPSAGPRRTFRWMVIPALAAACVLVAAVLYVTPVFSPTTLSGVEPPRAVADPIQPVPVPPAPAPPEVQPAQPPASPAPVESTTGRGPLSRPAAPVSSRSNPAAPAPPRSNAAASAPSRSNSAAVNPSAPAAVAPFGSLSINATPWADIWIDGKPVGQTPIANLQVTAGTYEILFRHPLLGEQRHTVQIGSLAPTRISVDLRH